MSALAAPTITYSLTYSPCNCTVTLPANGQHLFVSRDGGDYVLIRAGTLTFAVTAAYKVKAMAFADGYDPSKVESTAPLEKVGTPTIALSQDPPESSAVTVTITPGSGATSTRYTTNGSTPTSGSTLYTAPFTPFTAGGTAYSIKAVSFASGKQDSVVATKAGYTANMLSNPSITINGSDAPYSVEITADGGASIKYCVGSESGPWTDYSAPFEVTYSDIVYAYAYGASGWWTPSGTANAQAPSAP